jgi:periplasmic divalent cation tolerance protein
MDDSTEPLIVVMTTLPDLAIAKAIAQVLVEESYAACVQIVAGITSTYFWQGEICTESEQLLMIKTLASHYSDLETKLRSLHPYDQPEIIAIPVTNASLGYLNWVKRSLERN